MGKTRGNANPQHSNPGTGLNMISMILQLLFNHIRGCL